MPNAYFCVDCASPFPPMAATVAHVVGAYPSVVFRYLCDIPGVSTAITVQEAADIHSNGARVGLVFNGAGYGDVSSGYAHGKEQGQIAAARAKALGAPSGVWLPVDIESSFAPTSDYFAGYCDGTWGTGYPGGAYLNAQEQAHVGAWLASRKMTQAPAYLWTSEPEYDAWRGTIRSDWFDFTTLQPAAQVASQIVCHQYSESEINGLVDFDVCTAGCYASLLWAPAKTTMQVTRACALKVLPNHLCPAAIDGQHQPVHLAVGARVTPTGQTTPHWLHVTMPQSPVHGWLLKADVA